MIFGLICIIFGLFVFLKPEKMWKIQNRFMTEGGGPTQFYLTFARIVGAVAALIGILVLIAFFVFD